MEEKLLKILKLADLLNEQQDKVYAQIDYIVNDKKQLEISIKSKKDCSLIEKCQIQLVDNALFKLDAIIELFQDYVGGAINE